MIDNKNKLLDKVNDRYSIYIGPSEQTDFNGAEIYKIVNTNTGIIEGETSVLPKAYQYCKAFNDELDDILSLDDKEIFKIPDEIIN